MNTSHTHTIKYEQACKNQQACMSAHICTHGQAHPCWLASAPVVLPCRCSAARPAAHAPHTPHATSKEALKEIKGVGEVCAHAPHAAHPASSAFQTSLSETIVYCTFVVIRQGLRYGTRKGRGDDGAMTFQRGPGPTLGSSPGRSFPSARPCHALTS